MRRSLKSRKIH